MTNLAVSFHQVAAALPPWKICTRGLDPLFTAPPVVVERMIVPCVVGDGIVLFEPTTANCAAVFREMGVPLMSIPSPPIIVSPPKSVVPLCRAIVFEPMMN